MARKGLASLGAAAVLAVLVVAAVAPSPHALLWPDTVRDLSASLALARGEALPLRGPPINFGPHLGPAWVWLQAPILLASPSLVAASVYVALVAAMKFVLLYALGRGLSGRRLGLCFALGAALPSIAIYQWHLFWHPNWVETAIAGSLAVLVSAIRRRSLPWVYASAAVLGLAVQLHVTAVLYAPLLVFVLARLGVRGKRLVLHAAGLAAVLASWFAPVLLAPDAAHVAELHAGARRVGAGFGAFSAGDVLTVMRTAYVDVPLAIGETYASRLGIGPGAWLALLVAMMGVPAAGLALELATDRDRRRLASVVLVAAILAGWVAATAARTYTSFYLAFFLLPLHAIVSGLGLERMMTSGAAAARLAALAAGAATLATFAATAAGAWQVGASGLIESRLPLLQDLRHPAEGRATARWVGASARDAMARFACARGGEITLHGEWAYAVGGSTGLDLRLHCPEHAARPLLMGPSTRGWTVLAEAEAAKLDRKPAHHLRRLAAFPVRATLHPPQGRAIEPDWYYFEQLRDPQPVGRTSLAFETQPGEAVMLLRLKPFTSRWENLRVERDGAPAQPSLSTYNSLVFTSGTASRWRIEFDTDAPQWVDVHVF